MPMTLESSMTSGLLQRADYAFHLTVDALRELVVPSPAARLRRSAERGEAIELGSVATPFDELPERRLLLAELFDLSDLCITLHCSSAGAVRDVEWLTQIDRVHALTLRWRLEPGDISRLSDILSAASKLADHGLHTEIDVTSISGRVLERVLASAAQSRIGDVRGESPTLRPLRQAYGFPRFSALRG